MSFANGWPTGRGGQSDSDDVFGLVEEDPVALVTELGADDQRPTRARGEAKTGLVRGFPSGKRVSLDGQIVEGF